MESDPYALAAFAEEAFLTLGAQQIAYIKPVEIEGTIGAGIYTADGQQIGLAPSIALAQAMVRRFDLEPALVH